MLELTRELIEHYLRATGWHLDPIPSFIGIVWRRKDECFCDRYIDEEIDQKPFRVGSFDLFRLGVCAAAEDQYREARELLNRNDDLGPWAAGRMSAIADAWCWKSGIDPKAWEAARKQ